MSKQRGRGSGETEEAPGLLEPEPGLRMGHSHVRLSFSWDGILGRNSVIKQQLPCVPAVGRGCVCLGCVSRLCQPGGAELHLGTGPWQEVLVSEP